MVGKFKDQLGEEIVTDFCALRTKAYSFLIDGYSDDDYGKNKITNKKAKETKKFVMKRELMFKNYKDPLFNDEVIIRSQQRFRSDHHKVYTEEVNKIALISNDDKRIQTFDKVTTFAYGTNAFKVCENEMLLKTIKHSVEEKEEMNMSIIETNRTDIICLQNMMMMMMMNGRN